MQKKLYQKLLNISDVEIRWNHFNRRQEFHIACLIFDKEDRILVHEDADRGYEFGCIKRIYGLGIKNWKNICEDGYKDKYNINIKVEECPVPVATYYYEKSNAVGVIVMAEYNGNAEDINDRMDWNFYRVCELQDIRKKSVDNFIENINIAVKLRNLVERNDFEDDK